MKAEAKFDRLLRITLRINAGFSTLSGLVLLFVGGGAASLMGIGDLFGGNGALLLRAIGAGLLIFAGTLLKAGLRDPLDIREAVWIAWMDAGWVAGSAALLLVGIPGLTETGWWLIAAVADVVALFAALQFYAVHKVKRLRTPIGHVHS